MRPLLPSVALVTAVFLFGCQQQGSEPVGPDGLVPQFDRPIGACDNPTGGGHCHDDEGDDNTALILAGEELFFTTGTFGGNGRTCGTCHRAENNLTIDVGFIATLDLVNDALFVADNNSALTLLEDGGPTGLLRTRGLILENIQGFENPPVFRAPPSLFNLSFTALYGYNGDVPNLRAFTTGAVIQHFPRTLAREPGVDFVLPTEFQLDAL